MQGADAGPFAGSFLSGGVQDLVQESRSILLLESKDVTGDFNEVGVEFPLVPLGEDSLHLIVGESEQFSHQVIHLADELHVSILDAVVHHFDKVTGTAAADPITAGNIIHMG